MDQPSKKTLFEQKLSDSSTTLESLMAHDMFLEMFRGGNPQLLNFLKIQHYKKLITFVTVVGPQTDKIRSYQYPQLACDLFLSTESPTVQQILFSTNSESKNSQLIYLILDYFKSTPNYTLSGYVIKIIGNLYFHHPSKIQQFIFKGGYASLLLKFLQSKSVAQFVIRLIVVDDENLLNSLFQQRKQLLLQVIKLYTTKDIGIQQKSQLCFIIMQCLIRLWTNKHKQSGRFAPQIFKMIQIALNSQYQSYQDHENIVYIVMKNICNHTDVAPFLIKKLTKKILKQLSSFEIILIPSSHKKQVPRFTQRNLKFLVGLTHVMAHLSVIQELFKSYNIFGLLLGLMEQFQWNNIIHVEVEKIFKLAFDSQNQTTYNNIFKKGQFIVKVTQMINKQKDSKKFGKGYSGCLSNILIALNDTLKKQKLLGKLVKKHHPTFEKILLEYIEPKLYQTKVDLAGYKLNNSYAKAKYQQTSLLDKFSKFLDNHPSIQVLTSSISSAPSNEILQQIQDQSTMNQHLAVEDVQEDKKQIKQQIAI